MNTETKIYNDMSIREMLNNMPIGMLKSHKKEYIENCIQIYKLPVNALLSEQLRFRNFVMMNYYNSNKFQQPKISRSHAAAITRSENFTTIEN